MKTYFATIKYAQSFFLIISVLMLLTLPNALVFLPNAFSENTILRLYDVSHIAVFFVMMIRPLADIFTKTKYLRPLVILRKGVGVLSAVIVVSFIFAKIITDPTAYFHSLTTAKYWSLTNLALIAHLADLSALILLVTSNNLSKRLLGDWWKRIQRLSYVYFYASSLYVFLSYNNYHLLISMILVTNVTVIAFILNRRAQKKKMLSTHTV